MKRALRIVKNTDHFPKVEVDDFAECRRCNRKLKNPKWRALGYGPICLEVVRYERIMAEAGTPVDVNRQRKTARGDYRRAARFGASLA